MSNKIPSIIEVAKNISSEQLRGLNPKSNHLMRLIRNVDSLMNDAKILAANGGSRERVLFLYLTTFEQLRVTLALMDDLEKLPHGHSKNLALLERVINGIKDILGIKDGTIMNLRNSCLYEDQPFDTTYKLTKYITHLTQFLAILETNCSDILNNIDQRWHTSFQIYSDLGFDHESYERNYQESKKK